ncbi:hypothetical protein PVAND_016109 [Polypedilum vanderplanki]|uniref:F-box domain-containing protein n=1 Tax=Polypedilum vanderplanki TaxID=319348 RepID=A0A9J6BEH2_POLVA|nr:hypothetical protein PVAND_016109 [Polypedilum vanderplanki]
MESLPQELLIEIFQHLSIIDLVNLSKLNRNFREVIETTPKLKYFTLTFDKKGKTQSEKAKRFAELTVHHYSSRIHQQVLFICGINITNVNFIGSSVTYAQIANILRLTPNARQIKFENCSTWPEVVRQLPELKNNSLYIQLIESSSCILDIFLRSQVNALSLVNYSEEYGTGIRGFLGSQPHLKSLNCKGPKILDTFYAMGNSYSENYKYLPFRLKILVLKEISWNPIYADLLLPNCRSLTYIELIDIMNINEEFEEFINKCLQLEEFHLQNCYFSIIAPVNVKKLGLRGFVGQAKYIKKMKKLKVLKISNSSSIDYDFRTNQELEQVEVTGVSVYNSFSMPYVKKLVMNEIKKVPETLFKEPLSKIEEIHINNCGFCTDQILRELAISGKNLQNLTVTNGNVNREVLRNTRRILGNLKNFTTKNLIFDEE